MAATAADATPSAVPTGGCAQGPERVLASALALAPARVPAPAPARVAAPARVLVALGGNLGPVLDAFAAALAALAAAGAPAVAVSSAYRTVAVVPMGAPAGPDYWNAACELRTALSSVALLRLCQRLERRAGRIPGAPRWAPRPLDLDILAYGAQVRPAGGALELPHPRLAERAFVLRPLAELPRPWRLPQYDRSAAELLAALPDPHAGILQRRDGWWRSGAATAPR